jgi:hypothetical protein
MTLMRGIYIVARVGFATIAFAGQPLVRAEHMLDLLTRTPMTVQPSSRDLVMPPGLGRVGGRSLGPAEVTITLNSIDRETYALGESMVYEVLIRNTGTQPLTLPWSPDVQQFVDDPLPSQVQRAGVFLEVQDNRAQRVAWLQSQNLLGSPAVSGTLEVIYPGESAWIRIPARWRTNNDADNAMLRSYENSPLRLRAVLQLPNVLTYSTNVVPVTLRDVPR